jgi:ankyrin repeat protein
LELLIRRGADTCLQQPVTGSTSLHMAALRGLTARCKMLLAGGSVRALHLRTATGSTPAWVAVAQGHTAVLNVLQEHGADLHGRRGVGTTLLHYAVRNPAGAVHVETLAYLLSKGLNPNAALSSGVTPLHLAVEKSSLEAVRLLLDQGADVNAVDRLGRSALLGAATLSSSSSSSVDIVKLLIEREADVNASSVWQSPLLAAVLSGSVQCVQALINAGADVNQMCLNAVPGCSNVAAAVDAKFAQLAKLGVDTAERVQALAAQCSTAQHSDKLQPLLMAAGTPAVVRLLLAAGANVHATTAAGKTCLHIAAAAGYPAPVLCLLIKAGVNITAVDRNGRTAAELARAAGHTLAAALLTRAARDL